jgi:Polyketide cyclase / dehydrase and lipid transport
MASADSAVVMDPHTDGPTPGSPIRQGRISATQTIPTAAEPLFAFLADLDNHRLFADRHLAVARLDGSPGARHGGEIHLRGPLGLRRIVRTRVLTRTAPHLVAGRAHIGRRTVAYVHWRLHPQAETTIVELTTTIISAGLLDRVLLACGGRHWLRRRMAATLAALAVLIAAH